MTREEFEKIIIETVERLNGCKATELAARVTEEVFKRGEQQLPFDFVEILQKIIDRGDLEEVEYILPNLSFRTKSFVLPKGTQIFLGSNSEE